jgi:hypothetical protein
MEDESRGSGVGLASKCSTLRDYMPEEKETTQRPQGGASKEEIALEMMKFIAVTTGVGKTSAGAGFGGKAPKTPEEQVEVLLQLYDRCKSAVAK